jgi:hypothetical protein
MQRFLNNLTAIAVMGLISMSGSLAMAHGGGGHGGGHSSGGRSSGGHSSSHVSNNHIPQSHAKNFGKPKGHTKLVSKNDRKPPRLPPRHRRPPFRMHYPVRFWFDGDLDGGDAIEGGVDVAFTSIRQIDAGNPSKNLAPAYRVSFQNNSNVDIEQAFDVAILASTDEKLTEKLPYTSVRVEGMAAGETKSVDIRLPIEAMQMGSDDDQAAPFSFVHTIIDSQRELVETNKANNVSVDDREEIPSVEE